MPLWEDAALNNGLVSVVFDTLPVELEFLKDGYVQALLGQKYWGWGYDTVQFIYSYVVKGVRYGDWINSGMDIVTRCNVDAMSERWETSDFSKVLPHHYSCLD
jgi:ribose transport system substrate-binding protein